MSKETRRQRKRPQERRIPSRGAPKRKSPPTPSILPIRQAPGGKRAQAQDQRSCLRRAELRRAKHLDWDRIGAILRTRRFDASNGGPWTHEKTIAATKAGPYVLRSASPPHGQAVLSNCLRVNLNRLPIFARPPRSQSAGVSRKPKAAGAHTTPRVITPMTLAARSAPTPPHRDENSTAILGAPRLRRGATQIGRNAAPRARPVAASAHHAALSFKREATSLLHVEMAACVHHARKAP